MFLLAAADDDEIPQEFLLGKHQLSELGSESAKIKAMGISSRVLSIVYITVTVIATWCFFSRMRKCPSLLF